MQILSEDCNDNKLVLLNDLPSSIQHYPGKASSLHFINSDNKEYFKCAFCLHCKKPKCFKFDNFDISTDIPDVAYDQTYFVCPVDAISWNASKGIPVFDQSKCIKCGICARLCPIGAIYFTPDVTLSENNDISFVAATSENLVKHNNEIIGLMSVSHIGLFFNSPIKILESIYANMTSCTFNKSNLLIRNLLIALGNRCAIRRVGDVYTRFDALFETKHKANGVLEVEFGKETLDASRAILDDIAVANCRFKLTKSDNLPLVVCLQLPNTRQGYWQVIKDIKKVEKIYINTVTLGALLIIMWNFRFFDLYKNSFYVDYDDMSIRQKVDNIISPYTTSNIELQKLGILEPFK